MSEPQAGILPEPGPERRFLEYQLRPGTDAARLKDALKVAFQIDDDALASVVAFGPDCWRLLANDTAPHGLRSFEAIGPAPASQGDIWFWIHSDSHDAVLDHALVVHGAMAAIAEITLEVDGYTYHDNRDLIGFVDGTANPKGEAAPAAAFTDTGGSFVLTQKWVHDLAAFENLPVAEQEQVVGRTKIDDIELEGEEMPATSHVSRTDLKLNGVPAKILRRSSPYGGVNEKGLYFVAFACDIERFDIRLRHMFGQVEDGLHDRLTEFSTPISGSYWYAPSASEIAALSA